MRNKLLLLFLIVLLISCTPTHIDIDNLEIKNLVVQTENFSNKAFLITFNSSDPITKVKLSSKDNLFTFTSDNLKSTDDVYILGPFVLNQNIDINKLDMQLISSDAQSFSKEIEVKFNYDIKYLNIVNNNNNYELDRKYNFNLVDNKNNVTKNVDNYLVNIIDNKKYLETNIDGVLYRYYF